MPGLPVHHQLLELTQIHVHRVGDAIQPSHPVIPFSSCLQSFPASGSFQMSQFFTLGGQNIRISALSWVLPVNIQDWFALGWTGWIFLQSQGLSRIFSNTKVQKHQSSAFSFLYDQTHIHSWLQEKNIALIRWNFVRKVISLLFSMLTHYSKSPTCKQIPFWEHVRKSSFF